MSRNESELQFWRERNWAALKLANGALVALAGLSIFESSLALVPLILAIAVAHHAYQRKNMTRYKYETTIRDRLDIELGLRSREEDAHEGVIPPSGAGSDLWWGSGTFIAITWTITFCAVFAVIESAGVQVTS